MYVVAGVSGHTGQVVANTLLAQQLPVRVIVRTADKGEVWKKKGAEVVIADLKDGPGLTKALNAATSAYLLLPPNFAAKDLMANAKEHVTALKAGLAESGAKHVVFLSSIGAQHASGTGPIATLNYAERELSTLRTPFTFLRAGYFMENALSNMKPMQEHGVLPTLFDPAKPVAMVATPDIGAHAAWLMRQGAFAPNVVELTGPTERTMNDVAAAFGAVLGKKLNVAFVPEAGRVAALMQAGLPEVWAKAYAEMGSAVDAGLLSFTGSTQRGVITLETLVRMVMSK